MKDLITQDPDILGGGLIIKGARISVESILKLLAGGIEIKDILKEYPFLKKEHIQAAVIFQRSYFGSKTKLQTQCWNI